MRHIKIWDAGCAMGPEPFSLAIMFAENMGKFAFKNVSIEATDIDISGQFDKTINKGIFPKQQLDRIPQNLFKKYFDPNGKPDKYQIDYIIRQRIHYQRHDLLSLKPIGNNFILIVCKNVLLHFPYDMRIKVIDMFHQALRPGGYMAMEQTQKLPEESRRLFQKVTSNGQLFKKV